MDIVYTKIYRLHDIGQLNIPHGLPHCILIIFYDRNCLRRVKRMFWSFSDWLLALVHPQEDDRCKYCHFAAQLKSPRSIKSVIQVNMTHRYISTTQKSRHKKLNITNIYSGTHSRGQVNTIVNYHPKNMFGFPFGIIIFIIMKILTITTS